MLATLIKQYHFNRLQRATKNPRQRQLQILLDIVRANRKTGFGQAHQFAQIHSLEDFRRHVPVRTSAEYGPYLKRLYAGEHQLLTREAPYFFAMTAGSTGDYKYIPLTRSFKKEIDRAVYAFYHLLETNCPEFKSAPIQFFVGSAEGGHSPGGIPQGFVSGFNYKNLPAFIRRKFIVPYWVFTLTDIDDRFYAIGRFLASQNNLTGIGGFSPLAMMSVFRNLLHNTATLEQDIRNGTLTLKSPIPPSAYSPSTLPAFKPNPDLAGNIQSWRDQQLPAAELLALLFPGLRYIVSWMGGNMSYTMESLLQLTGPRQLHEMPFSASEGVFAIPFQLNAEGGIAAVTSHFLEYIREQDIDRENPPVYCAWELEAGQHYYQIVTTSAGLYRYNMEDLIRVKEFYNNTPVVQFISKKARQISISNERINENDVTESCRKVCEKSGVSFDQFVLFPTRANCYCLVVEESGVDLSAFTREFESALRAHAKGYDVERGAKSLGPVNVVETVPGKLRDYVNAVYFKSALPSSQYKPIHLSNSFTDADSFPVVRQHTLSD